jgi:hypothetical protein
MFPSVPCSSRFTRHDTKCLLTNTGNTFIQTSDFCTSMNLSSWLRLDEISYTSLNKRLMLFILISS